MKSEFRDEITVNYKCPKCKRKWTMIKGGIEQPKYLDAKGLRGKIVNEQGIRGKPGYRYRLIGQCWCGLKFEEEGEQ